MELTATSRTEKESQKGPFTLTPDDQDHAVVKRRINARKTVRLHENTDKKNLADEIAQIALGYQDLGSELAVLLFVRTVEDVEKIARKLPEGSVERLTGTLRGKERDALVKKPVFQRFLPESNRDPNVTPQPGTVYLVCTSAGEVGIDISADHMVCDLSTFDSMAQRFGRVNRFGDRDDTTIHLVHPAMCEKKGRLDSLDERRQRTLKLLQQLKGDGSPAAIDGLDATARQEAFAPTPTILPATDILFDAWSLTTIREKLPGRPPVEAYLHGVADWEPPRTQVAWREEVGVIKGDLLPLYTCVALKDLLDDYDLKSCELLQDIRDRVFKHLVTIANRHPEELAWLVNGDGAVKVLTLAQLADKDKKDQLNGRTVLLSPEVGGLRNGLLDGTAPGSSDAHEDVSEWFDKNQTPRRARVWDDDPVPEGMRWICTIDTKPDDDTEEDATDTDGAGPSRRLWRWYEMPKASGGENSRAAKERVKWQAHTDDVVTIASRCLERLGLPANIVKAIVVAARVHDLGKRRDVWQRGIGNPEPDKPLAKSGKGMKPRDLSELPTRVRLVAGRARPEAIGLGPIASSRLGGDGRGHAGRGVASDRGASRFRPAALSARERLRSGAHPPAGGRIGG